MTKATLLHPAAIVDAFLTAAGLNEWTPIRVLVMGSPRFVTSPAAYIWIDFEIDEQRNGRWFRVTYTLLRSRYTDKSWAVDNLQLICVSPSGIPLALNLDTVGHDMARIPVGDNRCNGYDLAFLAWYQRHGWQIHRDEGPVGVSVWTNGDAKCPFTVTRGMIERLEFNGHIERIFPPGAAPLDYTWAIKSK